MIQKFVLIDFRISNCEATKAFAVATSGSQHSIDNTFKLSDNSANNQRRQDRLSSSGIHKYF